MWLKELIIFFILSPISIVKIVTIFYKYFPPFYFTISTKFIQSLDTQTYFKVFNTCYNVNVEQNNITTVKTLSKIERGAVLKSNENHIKPCSKKFLVRL